MLEALSELCVTYLNECYFEHLDGEGDPKVIREGDDVEDVAVLGKENQQNGKYDFSFFVSLFNTVII